uniref:Uncharacterized protein n=1 Tax=Nelumbo nucifera TaxID=4432 RepID=A0A822Z5F1_NELNU|nr:TPA_asm: hypothetical protein HUJ06_013233 [Nelumbo nucifera]
MESLLNRAKSIGLGFSCEELSTQMATAVRKLNEGKERLSADCYYQGCTQGSDVASSEGGQTTHPETCYFEAEGGAHSKTETQTGRGWDQVDKTIPLWKETHCFS